MPQSAMSPLPKRPYRPPAPWPVCTPQSSLQIIASLRENPITSWGIWHFEREIFSASTILGHLTFASAPAAIKHVLSDNVANYPKDPLQLKVLKPGLNDGLVTSQGDLWKRTRRTVAPLFTPRAINDYTAAMRRRAEDMAIRLDALPEGARVNVFDEMTRVTFEILAETIFTDAIETGPEAYGEALTRYFGSQGRMSALDMLRLPDWIPRPRRAQASPTIDFFADEVRRIVDKRNRLKASGGKLPRDILTLLLEAADSETGETLSQEEVGANIITFIGAGHETNTNALSWTLFLLAKHPHMREAVEAEIEPIDQWPENEWLNRLPLTRAVIEESLRLYPPAPIMSRTALEADKIGEHHVPAGSLVIIAPYVVHRHRKLWAEPDLFRPERFLPGAREAINRYAFMPFGAGPRLCIGQHFAMHEAVIILATMLRRLRFSMAKGESVTPLHQVTLRPMPKLEMIKSSRSPP